LTQSTAAGSGPQQSQPHSEQSEPAASACDTYAASESDTQRKSAGVSFEKIDPTLAVPACESAVRQFPDNITLNYQLGRAYQKANNFNLALAHYRKAAEHNFALAQTNLGAMYANGSGMPQDYQEAARWYRKAADQGLGLAQFNLGQMYERGSGITQDYQQAIAWYRKAADQGQKEAKVKLAEVKAKLGALPAVTSSPTLEQTAAYILWSGDVDLSQMTTNSDGSVNTPFHYIFGSPFTAIPAAVTKVIDRPNCIVEVVMQAVQGMQPEKHMYVYFNRVNGFRDEEVYAAPLGSFTRIWALSESPVACTSGGGTGLTGELLPENYSCITDVPLVGGIKPQNLERVHKALDYLYSQFCAYATKKSPF
jgi:Sel1 repeat